MIITIIAAAIPIILVLLLPLRGPIKEFPDAITLPIPAAEIPLIKGGNRRSATNIDHRIGPSIDRGRVVESHCSKIGVELLVILILHLLSEIMPAKMTEGGREKEILIMNHDIERNRIRLHLGERMDILLHRVIIPRHLLAILFLLPMAIILRLIPPLVRPRQAETLGPMATLLVPTIMVVRLRRRPGTMNHVAEWNTRPITIAAVVARCPRAVNITWIVRR